MNMTEKHFAFLNCVVSLWLNTLQLTTERISKAEINLGAKKRAQ